MQGQKFGIPEAIKCNGGKFYHLLLVDRIRRLPEIIC